MKKKTTEIVRRPDFAGGGITDAERQAMAENVKLWTARAFRTDPIEPDKITGAIRGLYSAAHLKQPRIIIVPSPFVMALAGGFASAIWYSRKQGWNATSAATDAATRAATDDNTVRFMLACAKRWNNCYQGGNMWSAWDCYLTAARDILGLCLPQHEAYHHWEQAAINGGFRWMHEEFCMVSDFPEILKVDDQNRPHSEIGPSHRWRDGWSIYHWHGVRVPAHWIEDRANLDPREVIQADNVELRAAGAAIVGWPRMLQVLKARVINDSGSPTLGQLIELDLPGLDEPGLFLKAECPRNGTIVEGVPRVSDIDNLPIDTAIAAQAWRIGDPQSEYAHPPRRT